MKIEVGSCEAKTKLPELLWQVREGKAFTITSRGKPIAYLVPTTDGTPKDKAAVVGKLRALMTRDPVRDADIKELMEDGRS